jgi:hypothetical protein
MRHTRGMQMTEVRALNRDAAKQQPESVFETPLEIVNEILLRRARSSPRLTGAPEHSRGA